jgi:hypothetical protein
MVFSGIHDRQRRVHELLRDYYYYYYPACRWWLVLLHDATPSLRLTPSRSFQPLAESLWQSTQPFRVLSHVLLYPVLLLLLPAPGWCPCSPRPSPLLDWDGDLLMDVILYSPSAVRWCRNLGGTTPTFEAPASVLTPSGALRQLLVVDVSDVWDDCLHADC